MAPLIDRDLATLADAMGVTAAQLRARGRPHDLARARGVCYYLLRGQGHTTVAIAAALGRDYSTIVAMSNRMARRALAEPATRALIAAGRSALRRTAEQEAADASR